MHLNHPETFSHPQSVEKLSSMKLVPDAKKVGEPLHRRQLETQSMSISAENPIGEHCLERNVSFLICLFSATLCPHPNIMDYVFPQ